MFFLPHPTLGKISWRREWLPTPVFLPGEFQGQRSLVGYSPWGCKESDTTEWLTLSLLLFHSLQDLSSPTSDWTLNLCIESEFLTTGPPEMSQFTEIWIWILAIIVLKIPLTFTDGEFQMSEQSDKVLWEFREERNYTAGWGDERGLQGRGNIWVQFLRLGLEREGLGERHSSCWESPREERFGDH